MAGNGATRGGQQRRPFLGGDNGSRSGVAVAGSRSDGGVGDSVAEG